GNLKGVRSGNYASLVVYSNFDCRRRYSALIAHDRTAETVRSDNRVLAQAILAAASCYGRCARRKERIWRTARGIRSLGSFQGNMLISALGASIADSMATFNECASVSSGRISTGVWQLRTKSRVAVKTKSGLVRYILVRYFSTIAIVISGRRLTNSGPQPVMLPS